MAPEDPPVTDPADAELGRLRWRCRRGMKELDLKLERYLDQCWAEAAAPERAAFVALLEAPDPEIWGLLLGRDTPAEGEAARLIQRLQEL